MKPITTEFNAIVPNHIEIENTLKSNFPGYSISHSGFTDIWRIKDKTYTHSVWYNAHKISKFITPRNHMATELILIYIISLISIALIFLLDQKYDWGLGLHNMIIGWLAAGGISKYLLPKIKPKYNDELQNEHDKIFNTLAQLFPEEMP